MQKKVWEKENEVKNPSMCKFKSIYIFNDLETGKSEEFLIATGDLDNVLAIRKINLVYGGGFQGLWKSIAISASIKRSKVLCIVMNELDDKSFCIGNELRVSSMLERMWCMLYNADAFITLPSGLETLKGISSIAYWAKLNFHKKTIRIVKC